MPNPVTEKEIADTIDPIRHALNAIELQLAANDVDPTHGRKLALKQHRLELQKMVDALMVLVMRVEDYPENTKGGI